MLLEVDSTSLEKKRLQSKAVPIKKKLNENNIKYDNFKVSEKEIKFDINNNSLDKFEAFFNNKKENNINIFLSKYNAFELDYLVENNSVKVFLSKYGSINIKEAAVDQSIEIVRRRIDEVGTKEPSILKRGNNRILVELPGIKNPDRIKDLLGKTAELSFRLVTDDKSEFGIEKYLL